MSGGLPRCAVLPAVVAAAAAAAVGCSCVGGSCGFQLRLPAVASSCGLGCRALHGALRSTLTCNRSGPHPTSAHTPTHRHAPPRHRRLLWRLPRGARARVHSPRPGLLPGGRAAHDGVPGGRGTARTACREWQWRAAALAGARIPGARCGWWPALQLTGQGQLGLPCAVRACRPSQTRAALHCSALLSTPPPTPPHPTPRSPGRAGDAAGCCRGGRCHRGGHDVAISRRL